MPPMDGVQIPRPHGDLDYHRARDQARLAEKVKGDVDIHKLVLERPREAAPEKSREDQNEKAAAVIGNEPPVRNKPGAVALKGVMKQGGADSDPVMRERRDKVREVSDVSFVCPFSSRAYHQTSTFIVGILVLKENGLEALRSFAGRLWLQIYGCKFLFFRYRMFCLHQLPKRDNYVSWCNKNAKILVDL